MSKIASFKENGTSMVAVPFKAIPRHDGEAFSLTGGVTINVDGKYVYPDGRVCSHPDGIAHDCKYVEARNRLIPRARQAAGDDDAKFMAEMTRLWEGRSLPK